MSAGASSSTLSVYLSELLGQPPIRTHQVTELPGPSRRGGSLHVFTLDGDKHRKVEPIMVTLQVNNVNWIWKLILVLLYLLLVWPHNASCGQSI